jgi:hypothetical protein
MKSSWETDTGERGVELSGGITDGRRTDEKLDRLELVDATAG